MFDEIEIYKLNNENFDINYEKTFTYVFNRVNFNCEVQLSIIDERNNVDVKREKIYCNEMRIDDLIF